MATSLKNGLRLEMKWDYFKSLISRTDLLTWVLCFCTCFTELMIHSSNYSVIGLLVPFPTQSMFLPS